MPETDPKPGPGADGEGDGRQMRRSRGITFKCSHQVTISVRHTTTPFATVRWWAGLFWERVLRSPEYEGSTALGVCGMRLLCLTDRLRLGGPFFSKRCQPRCKVPHTAAMVRFATVQVVAVLLAPLVPHYCRATYVVRCMLNGVCVRTLYGPRARAYWRL